MDYEPHNIPEYVSVTVMAKLMQLSRARMYQLIDQGVLEKPVYLISNKRPVYTRELALRNLEVKRNHVGVNGQIIMFYSMRTAKPLNRTVKPVKPTSGERPSTTKHQTLIDDIKALGLEGVKAADIETAIAQCFPNGIANLSEDETLITIFRYLKRQDSEHKPRT